MKAPPAGWTTKSRVVNVVDGDTVDVEIRRKVRVRLLDCWAPETRTRDLAEKMAGLAATNALRLMLPINAEVTLHIPTDGSQDIGHILTLNRVLGRIYVGDTDVGAELVERGLAELE